MNNRIRTLILIRRVEALSLLVFALALPLADRGMVALVIPLLSISLLLAWQNFKAQAAQKSDLKAIDELLNHGWKVHGTFEAVDRMRRSWQRTREMALAQYEAEKWIARVRPHLKRYPEFSSIFEASRGASPTAELADRLHHLEEIQSLVKTAHRVGLRR